MADVQEIRLEIFVIQLPCKVNHKLFWLIIYTADSWFIDILIRSLITAYKAESFLIFQVELPCKNN